MRQSFRLTWHIGFVALFGALLVVADKPSAAIAATTTELVSTDSASNAYTIETTRPLRMSRNGRYVVFAGSGPASGGVYLRDRQAGATELQSVDSDEQSAIGSSNQPVVSDDGRYVAFQSNASNLVPGDFNGAWDVFVRDRFLGVTERVSVDSNENQAAGGTSQSPTISGDGRFVAYFSEAINLVPGDTNGKWDVFVRDRLSGTTERASVDSNENEANGPFSQGSYWPRLSADGRYVAFESWTDNLVPDDSNSKSDVFIRDLLLGTTELVSRNSSSVQGNNTSVGVAISSSGRRVAFTSSASNLVSGDSNGLDDIFLRDLDSGITTRVSVDTLGAEANGHSYDAEISGDGLSASFQSAAFNLVAGDTNGVADVFRRDTTLDTTDRLSLTATGGQATGLSRYPSMSSDGSIVAFASAAPNIVPSDTVDNDAFVRVNATSVGGIAEQPDVTALRLGESSRRTPLVYILGAAAFVLAAAVAVRWRQRRA